MRFVCISDTHKLHNKISVPDGDVLIFAGDMCGGGSEKSARKFVNWFSNHPHTYKILVAGNHDKCFENASRPLCINYAKSFGLIYLEHEPVIIRGLKFFGSPYQPEFCSWAFNVPRGELLKRKWSQIPDDTDILITHGPPHLILDSNGFEHCGCEDLLKRTAELKKLKLHVFGHIHESYGIEEHDGVKFVNASVCTDRYEPKNVPIIVDL